MLAPVWTLAAAVGIPTAFTGFCFWLLQRKISKRDAQEAEERRSRQAEIDRKENTREKTLFYTLKGVYAAISLSEATAKAVERIPDAHCNGDMHEALTYADKIKHELRDFTDREMAHQIFGDSI